MGENPDLVKQECLLFLSSCCSYTGSDVWDVVRKTDKIGIWKTRT